MTTTLKTNGLTPRDLNSMALLKQHGLSLVEVKISQVSFAKGLLLSNVPLPDSTRVICVVRGGRSIVDLEAVFLEEGDLVYLITENERLVRSTFTVL